MCSYVTENQIGRYRRDLIKSGFTKLALDVELFGEAEAAVSLDTHISGEPRGLRSKHLGHVCFVTQPLQTRPP